MDKVKIVLAILKKHHFWVLCGLVLVVSLVVWWKATGTLADQFKLRTDTLERHFKAMEGIWGELNHPNQEVVDAIKGETEKLKEKVLELWEKLYADQKKKNRLPENLSEEFQVFFWELDDEIPLEYREEYRQFIQEHFTKLFQDELNVLRPKEKAEGESVSGGPRRPPPARRDADSEYRPTAYGGEKGSGRSRPVDASRARTGTEMIGIVAWDRADRERLKNRFRWEDEVPGTEQVRNAQEDLWVIEALVRVIKSTNQGATGPYNAAVKEILALEIGADAVNEATVKRQETKASGRESGKGRYVDEDGESLAPGEESPYAEFKMMPVSLKLMMEQTSIPTLLVACANSKLPIEVLSVRLRPDQGTPLDLSHLATTGGTAGSGGGRTSGEAHFGSGRAGSKIEGVEPADSLDIPVEIQGIIYIYNPPDEGRLGTGSAGEKPADTAPATTPQAAPGTTPAATPATPPAAGPAAEGQPPAAGK